MIRKLHVDVRQNRKILKGIIKYIVLKCDNDIVIKLDKFDN
jgi:hypothetical protein